MDDAKISGSVSALNVTKNDKYDRQLRLWGDHGQTSLEAAKVCLINATATGTEVLKNLILPGIGAFTIVDGERVTEEDLGNNFFVTSDSVGKSRAQVATELLLDMNSDVLGDYIDESPESLLNAQPQFFTSFNLVIATNLSESCKIKLAAHLWEHGIPLVLCRCYGFIGYIRLVLNEHTVIESHPDNTFDDLRLDAPFPALVEFCDSFNLDTMNKKDHSHTPWLILIYKYLEKWKQNHNGESPKSYKEKKELKENIRQGIRKTEEGIPEEEDNFEEAMQHLNTALLPTKVPSTIEKLFNDPNCCHITSESSSFWILVRALKDFVQTEGCLPLRGSIPDMTSDSQGYISLQNIYQTKAAEDIDKLTSLVNSIIETHSLPPLSKGISEQDIKLFCKNSAFLSVIKGRSLAEEYSKTAFFIQQIARHLESEDSDEVMFYVLLRASDMFASQYNRLPGESNDQVESDIFLLKGCVTKLLSDWGLGPAIKDDYIHEMCRYGGAELHSVAAYIGGAAAQEIIKVITGQFIPIDNTFIYNAMKQSSITLRL